MNPSDDNGDDDDDNDRCDFPSQEPLPEYRLSTGSNPGSILMCWPSKGGIYRLSNVHNVQRQFLGFDRRVAKILRPEASADAEDAFCNQLRKLGARWWKSESPYDYEFFVDQYTGRPAQDKSALYIGWPASGGVWALSMDFWDAAEKGYGVIYNSLTMEEQCEMIEEFGGTFYQDPKDCPYLDLPENEPTPS
ncbi:hypothetical protein TRIATDRAFT_312517 [Trichoderma atroviride IMI 206040]|uniref:Uncharacterized protein n=2 Tax=Hypocrea atroviridis TaxID=63577 RepID=G9P4K2_HYPAI|nr:uncharacterized protein TRIATDRAFT_312517 [Trichoderma atroviride IMI 206040]EHK41988.1 hypothetical protein TRIATDRAFT_312517 [Trichoderma atroviride IMI 206040]